MQRSSATAFAVIIATALTGLSSNARATCAIPTAGYSGGLYGAAAVASSSCFISTASGGSGVTGATETSPNGLMSATANLATGVLTAFSMGGIASAAEWDTFTFAGLPAQGATITAKLTLSGTFSGDGTADASIQAGPSSAFETASTTVQSGFFNAAMPPPDSISVQFIATDTSSVTVLGEILADGSSGNVADLTDPPTLTIDLPPGVTATSASGAFTGFTTAAAVPEPGSAGLLLAALCILMGTRWRQNAPAGRNI